HLCRLRSRKNHRGGIMLAFKASFRKRPAIPDPGTTGWAQYQSCLQQQLTVSPQQSARILPVIADEGRKVIAIRNNNLLSNVQKIQEVKTLQKQSDQQLKAILSSAQYDKLNAGRKQAIRCA